MNERRVLVQIENLTKIYGGGVEVRALDNVTFDIYEGEMLAVMGASGSGKSTLLNMMGALDTPTAGTVYIEGQDLSTIKDVDRFRSQTVGFVFQMYNLIPTLTALENVETPLRGQGLNRRERHERASTMLELVGLAARRDHLPNQLSGGQRQRVAIARALVNEPSLVLADEPTGNLDSVSGNELMDLLIRLNQERGTTLLLVTHDRYVARTAERILTMHDGQIVNEHMVRDPLTEDLRDLAHSTLGELLMQKDIETLKTFPFVRDGRLTRTADQLADLLADLT
ncbi:MAG: ABC transporter ATP-binding protein [Anaerolineales bacterium]